MIFVISHVVIAIQGVKMLPIEIISFRYVEVGEAVTGLSIENTRNVTFSDCFIGGHVGVPTQVTDKDHLFDR